MKRRSSLTLAAAAVTASLVGGSAVSNAAPPLVATDDGAFVRLLGSPADGTVKFQFGWEDDSVASDAAGYWVGVYDVTNSHYVWVSDTGPVDLPDQFFRNAKPTPDLPNGDYKINLFVRATYVEPVTNLAEIEFPFQVTNSMG